MGYCKPDVYNQPEAFGLTPVAELAWWDYDFSATIVWQHGDGTLYIGYDSGCSCVSPFEDFTSLDDLTVLDSMSTAEKFANQVYSLNDVDKQNFLREVSELLR